MKPPWRSRHRHPQYVTHAQLSQEMDVVNKKIVSQAAQNDGLAERVRVLEVALAELAEDVAVLETLIS